MYGVTLTYSCKRLRQQLVKLAGIQLDQEGLGVSLSQGLIAVSGSGSGTGFGTGFGSGSGADHQQIPPQLQLAAPRPSSGRSVPIPIYHTIC
jgi:hypothetical protein